MPEGSTPAGYTVDGEHGTGAEEVRVMSTRQTTAVLEVVGVHWATERPVTEKVLGRRAGVLAVEADPIAQTAMVTYDPATTATTDRDRDDRQEQAP